MSNLEMMMGALVRSYLKIRIQPGPLTNPNTKFTFTFEVRLEEVEPDYVANLGLKDICIEVDDRILQPLCIINDSNKWIISDPKFYEILKVVLDHESSKNEDLKDRYILDIQAEENDLGRDIKFIKSLKKLGSIIGPEKTKTLIEWVDYGKGQNKE